jgi:hypothetical protein
VLRSATVYYITIRLLWAHAGILKLFEKYFECVSSIVTDTCANSLLYFELFCFCATPAQKLSRAEDVRLVEAVGRKSFALPLTSDKTVYAAKENLNPCSQQTLTR